MRVHCDKNALIEGLALVGRAVPLRSTMPILECILLRAGENGLFLEANDLEMSIRTAAIPADVDKPGAIALDAKLFTEIIRKMPDDAIRLHINDNGLTECISGRARFKIMGLNGDEFPEMPEIINANGREPLAFPAADLKDMIRQTIFSVAMEDTKPILTGELMQCRDNKLVVVSVDGFRISYRCLALNGDFQDARAVVPGKALNELSRILPASGDISFFFTEKHAVFTCDAFIFISRLLEGEFIRYEQIFSEDFTTLVTIDRLALYNALERACLLQRDNKKAR